MDLETELRFLAVFFAAMLLAQVVLLLWWVAAKGARRANAAIRRARGPEAERTSTGAAQPFI